jgi:hypothetical protein
MSLLTLHNPFIFWMRRSFALLPSLKHAALGMLGWWVAPAQQPYTEGPRQPLGRPAPPDTSLSGTPLVNGV